MASYSRPSLRRSGSRRTLRCGVWLSGGEAHGHSPLRASTGLGRSSRTSCDVTFGQIAKAAGRHTGANTTYHKLLYEKLRADRCEPIFAHQSLTTVILA